MGIIDDTRVIAWREPKERKDHLINFNVRFDEHGVGLNIAVRCEYCGCLTVRYDTVEHLPCHLLCWKLACDEDADPITIENVYIAPTLDRLTDCDV